MIFRSRVINSGPPTPTSHMIRIEKPDEFTFLPVQFCGLEIMTSEGSEEYPMSLASSPTRNYLEFGARISPSPWKTAFAALKPGDEVEVDGAYGHFVLDEKKDAVFIAGGIGITPLKGMAEYLSDTGSSRHAVMIFSNRSQEEIAFRKELSDLERANPHFTVVHTLTREPEGSGWEGRHGRIDIGLISEYSSHLNDPKYYLCGTGSMVTETGNMLLGHGVPRDRVDFEVFRGYG